MVKFIDNFLNQITMYRLTWYCLLGLWIVGLLLSLFGLLPYQPLDFILTGAIIFGVCVLTNYVFAYLYKAPSNIDSVYITVLILMLIISPAKPLDNLNFIILASFLAMGSKYAIALFKKHLFNPAAFGVAVAAFIINKYAVWWIGTLWMAVPMLIVGFLIVRKIQRADLVFSFLSASFILVVGHSLWFGQNLVLLIRQLVIDSPWMFLAFVMLTEPTTTPPKRYLRIGYGLLVGILFTPFVNVAGYYFTPEIALLVGNIASYFVSPKERIILTLKNKSASANNVYDFIFQPDRKLNFAPGQYMEWTLYHEHQDHRGIRRYFTIASSPTEPNVVLGVKFYPKPSSYKKTMEELKVNDKIMASQLAGDFTLPKDKKKKLVFLAGGIGVTPFRSMVKYLTDKQEKRDVVVFYANNTYADIAYQDVFDGAQERLNIKVRYSLKDSAGTPPDFSFIQGMITSEIIKREVPDWRERIFYISGPKSMVDQFKLSLKQLGIPATRIKTDFFPGFA